MNKTGFGFLRLPRLDAADEKSIDHDLLNAMVDRFLELGGTYFDTAYTYLGGASEEAIRTALVERHPRDAFVLADKLPGYLVKSHDECWDYFHESCRRCGVDYFDVFLLHWLNEKHYAMAEQYDEFGFLRQLKAEGKARKIGFSYHDSPELLDRILSAHPEVDYVQLQLNYLDWDSPTLQAAACYEVAARHGKKILVMEPVRGGHLASLPAEAEQLLRGIRPGESPAAWALRFVTELPQVEVVLSGMNAMAQIEDNMRPFPPLTDEEHSALKTCAELLRSQTAVPCTGCGYCLSHCPNGLPIPKFFALYNDYARDPRHAWKMGHAYDSLAKQFAPASSCIGCGQCAKNCPQKLPIPTHLAEVAKAFAET